MRASRMTEDITSLFNRIVITLLVVVDCTSLSHKDLIDIFRIIYGFLLFCACYVAFLVKICKSVIINSTKRYISLFRGILFCSFFNAFHNYNYSSSSGLNPYVNTQKSLHFFLSSSVISFPIKLGNCLEKDVL